MIKTEALPSILVYWPPSKKSPANPAEGSKLLLK